MTIFTKLFWVYAGERAIKTVVQTAISILGVASVTGILGVALVPLLSAVALAGVLSVLNSVLSYTPGTVTVAVPV